MPRHYYTLAVREHGHWSPEFGDYSRKTVADELDDYRDHGVRKHSLKIVKTGDRQADIMAAIAAMNTGA